MIVATLLEKLKEQGKLTDKKARDILEQYEKENVSVESILQKKHLVSSKDIAKIKSQLIGIPYLEIDENIKVEESLYKYFPKGLVENFKVIPIEIKGDVIKVGMVRPEDIEADNALDFIENSNNIQLERFVISEEDFEKIIKNSSSLQIEVSEALDRLKEERLSEKIDIESDLYKITEKAPISKTVDVILKYGVESEASDIHIEPTKNDTRIRYRLDGKLHTSLIMPLNVSNSIISRIKIMSKMRVDESRIPQDGRISQTFNEKLIDFRVSTFPTNLGEKATLRILDNSKGIVDLEKLGVEGRNIENIKDFSKLAFGTMLISGPTGSGKSTTLYSVLNILNKEDVNIITLEDPVEYYLDGINQSQIRPEIGYDFSSGLRSVVRQDPDIIMVGEVRDNITASLLVHAALTGHLVFSTIHTNNAIGIIPRLIDMKIDSYLIPASISLLVAQRLVTKLCGFCSKKVKTPYNIQKMIADEMHLLKEEEYKKLGLDDLEKQEWPTYKSEGCDKCGQTGIIGRIGVFETLKISSEIEKVIIENLSESNLKKEARKQGMITMRQDGILKALRGVTSIEIILSKTMPS
ncbi:MAG: ATPase, T2SS/T4P/T4SS family [Patescibacteria group bacterium]